jgi:hypothetical protein
MLTADRLAKRARRRVQLALDDFGSAEHLRPCWTPACTRCDACQLRAPLSGELWAVLFARARPPGRPWGRRLVSSMGAVSYALTAREELAAQLEEALERELVRRRVEAIERAWAKQRQWDREDLERADCELVAAVVSARAAKEHAA